MRAGEKLRRDVRSNQITPLIGVFDMFSASLVAQHYGGMFISGFGFSASYYGMQHRLHRVAGHGQLRAAATVAFPQGASASRHRRWLCRSRGHQSCGQTSGRIGASGVILEDQKRPRRCHKVRRVIGDKPLLFNQIAGGKSPRLSLAELEDLGVNVAICSTPCLFAAQTAIENALLELRANDGRLPEVKDGDVGVTASTELLERNISHEPNHGGNWLNILDMEAGAPDGLHQRINGPLFRRGLNRQTRTQVMS